METYHQYGPHTETPTYWKWDKKLGWVFSTKDWLYADTLRYIEDCFDEENFTDSVMSEWKYNGEP
jgi:hypothetical protein